MVFADLVRAAIMLSFPILLAAFATRGTVGPFVPLMFVGIFAAVFSPARSALLPTLIRQNQLVRANAMISGLGVIATMIAVMIGGKIADTYADPRVAFYIDAGTFMLSAVLLLLLRPPPREVRGHHADAGMSALVEGVRYVVTHRRVAQLIGVAVVVWLCGSIVRSTIPALVRDVYRRPEYFEMTLFQARLAFGMLAGALILTALGDAIRSEIAITWTLLGMGGAILLLGLSALVPMSVQVAYHLGGASIILAGVFAAGLMASYRALIQRIVPNRLLGRVFGLNDLATVGGLLLATGLLGIPHWPGIDRWIGWLLLGTTGIIAGTATCSLIIRLRSGRMGRRLQFWWNLNGFWCRFWYRLQREGICTVPPEGPVIVVANHTCAADPLLLIASTPNRILGFLVAEEYTNVPIAGRLIRMVGCIPVRRDGHDAAGTRAALRHLRAGGALGIFIEGRIAQPGEIIAPKDGAAMLALHSGALVVPAHISGTRYHDSVLRSLLRRHRARVRFGRPLDLSRYYIPKADKETVSRISSKFLDGIRALGEEADAARQEEDPS
jgi:1-acyl-sn-glycerol-3-phosphate acyltransferase